MRTYRVEFAGNALFVFVNVLLITLLCLSIIGLPFGIVILPTLYQLVEEERPSA
jgi:hypothetical protein